MVLAVEEDGAGAVEVVLPSARRIRGKDDLGMRPLDAVVAARDGDRPLRTPGEPHVELRRAARRDVHVEAGAEFGSAQHGARRVFRPVSSRRAKREDGQCSRKNDFHVFSISKSLSFDNR